jgi:DNA-directed RNA polymerase subunit alpha
MKTRKAGGRKLFGVALEDSTPVEGGELVQKSRQDMLEIRNFGRTSLKELEDVLATMGLALGMKIEMPSAEGS